MSNSYTFRSKIVRVIGALALVIAAVATPTHANSELIVKHVTVRFSDLNLQNEAGAEKLIVRLEQAAVEACGGSIRSGGPMVLYTDMKSRVNACRVGAVRTAVAKIDRPMVTALYEGKYRSANRVAAR